MLFVIRGCGAKQNGLSDKALQCLLKDNVALVLVLELCINGQQAGLSGRVCVATTHIYQNQGFPNVKMWQVCSHLLWSRVFWCLHAYAGRWRLMV